MNTVIKRDGRRVPFDRQKIQNAINGAFQDVKQQDCMDSSILARVMKYIDVYNVTNKAIAVEKIQDIVERVLMEEGYYNVAKAYIRYRYEHELERQRRNDKDLMEMVQGNSDYWNTENSNKNVKWVTTQRDYMAGIISTDLARKYIFPKEVIEAHDAGIIHIHDMDYAAQNTLHNCFSSDTKFVTSQGVKSFQDFYDGDSVVVRDRNGQWRSAVVKNFGKQILYTVKMHSGRSVCEIRCTRNHRWVLADGSVTTNLSVGDKLYALPDVTEDYVPQTDEQCRAFCFGFVLGDGTDIQNSRGVRVRLCGDKTQYRNFFERAGYFVTPIKDSSDLVAQKKDCISKQSFLDAKMWKVLSSEQKESLFRGYYAADGAGIDRNLIATADVRLLELIQDLSAIAGYYIAKIRHNIHTTPYKENAELYAITFRKKQNSNNLWTVDEIVKSYNNNHTQNVWCVIEPVTHTFTLAQGIVTGNCCLINLDDMLQNGTVVNGVSIDKPHRLSTAMTIATQIIAAVASSQYGGCTITLTHLAPFVRLSFERFRDKYISWGFDNELAEKMAHIDTKKEVADAVQTLNYQLNSLTTTNGQAPFISVMMYLGETKEYKDELAMLIEEVLNQRIRGMKNRVGVYVTIAFPKLLYVLEEDNIHPDSKYWYLTELAAKCTAKRMVPDYISEKVMKQLKLSKGETEGNGDCYPCMGQRKLQLM